jgi:hypothetical protein
MEESDPIMSGLVTALTEAQLAYVAAILDTQANLTQRTVRDAVLPQVDVNGGRIEVLHHLGALTEVRIVETKRSYSRAPCTEHCAGERHLHIESVSGRWSVSGAKATIVLAAVQPYLVFRPAEIETLVEVGLGAGFKGATVDKMAALGWPIPEAMQWRAA